MATWSLEQISQVRGLRAVAQVDPEILSRGGVDVARRKMVGSLTQMAHAFAVELHPGDFQFDEANDLHPKTFTVEIRCWWEPATREVELRGGHIDGEVVTFRDAPNGTLAVARPMPPPMFVEPDETHPSELIQPLSLHYRLSGWDESERRWIYGPIDA